MVAEDKNEIRILETGKVTMFELKKIAEERYGDLAKAVVDVEKRIMAVGGEMHADEEALLLDRGSRQNDLWGINIFPDREFPDIVEFDSMINLRPGQGNRSRGVDDPSTREAIMKIVRDLVE